MEVSMLVLVSVTAVSVRQTPHLMRLARCVLCALLFLAACVTPIRAADTGGINGVPGTSGALAYSSLQVKYTF